MNEMRCHGTSKRRIIQKEGSSNGMKQYVLGLFQEEGQYTLSGDSEKLKGEEQMTGHRGHLRPWSAL